LTGAAVEARCAAFRDRAERAAHLAGERPHAAEILTLYGVVVSIQEPLFDRALAPDGPLTRAVRGLAGHPYRLPLERLPYSDLDAPFVDFVADLAAASTDALTETGNAILRAPAGIRAELLRRTAGQGDLEAISAGLGYAGPDLVFFSRGFLQPVVEALADGSEVDGSGTAAETEGACPRCGWPPQAAVLCDDGAAQGRRTLVCGLCATEWSFPRVRCPSCGETDAGKLVLHEAESVPGLRLAECQSCQGYLKEVDLRREGHAIPVVEDLATPELDLWAGERGLWKICRNLVGL
jgi:FdhE protein